MYYLLLPLLYSYLTESPGERKGYNPFIMSKVRPSIRGTDLCYIDYLTAGPPLSSISDGTFENFLKFSLNLWASSFAFTS